MRLFLVTWWDVPSNSTEVSVPHCHFCTSAICMYLHPLQWHMYILQLQYHDGIKPATIKETLIIMAAHTAVRPTLNRSRPWVLWKAQLHHSVSPAHHHISSTQSLAPAREISVRTLYHGNGCIRQRQRKKRQHLQTGTDKKKGPYPSPNNSSGEGGRSSQWAPGFPTVGTFMILWTLLHEQVSPHPARSLIHSSLQKRPRNED